MKALLVGGGGREHAIAWKLLRDDPSLELICAPGNAGICDIAECIPVKAQDVPSLLGFARRADVDLTVVGPEGPLAAGIVDAFRASGLAIFGPTQAAAEIETSKRFAKALMFAAGVPTASARHFADAEEAKRAVGRMGAPVVIKASGLAAGKGVIVARSIEEAERAIEMMLSAHELGPAGDDVLVEEFMRGEELSLFFLTDGENVIPLIPAQDHKRLLDGDLGPNTGGMGAYAPVSFVTQNLVDEVTHRIALPTLRTLREAGRRFAGVLYAGLMLTDDGPMVVEFNCRFGDPETQAVLPLMRSSLLELVDTIASGGSLADAGGVQWEPGHAVTTVIAAAGYPGTPETGEIVRLPAQPQGIEVFHAGTQKDPESGEIHSAGGRVLSVTGLGSTIHEAAARSLEYAERVTLKGKQLRRDIAWREQRRSAGAS